MHYDTSKVKIESDWFRFTIEALSMGEVRQFHNVVGYEI